MASPTVKELLHTAAYLPGEMDQLLDPERESFVRFDPDLGYELKDYVFRDGMEDTLCTYNYEEPGGHRQMINQSEKPCRINTYGDSFTQCAQVNDGETWQEILAAHMREPIRNFGVGGYGVYQAYLRSMRVEPTDLGAEYIILNVWDDDHYRNIDAARWIRVAWWHQDLPRGGGEGTYPVHGFPWGHVRYNIETGEFEEKKGFCRSEDELRRLADKDYYYEVFKDDPVVHLFALREGGEAPVDYLEKLGEAFGMEVDLRDPEKRKDEAYRLHTEYALRSTAYIADKLRDWCGQNDRKLMVLLSYDTPTVKEFIQKGSRFDAPFVDYLEENDYTYVDCLEAAAQEYEDFGCPVDDFLSRHYIARAGAQVFGHYNPAGNFWFAHAIRRPLAQWLDPAPPSYR